ncbi:MAG TPA: hypothetical protein VFS67_03980 [Polyangiaceae bacterium]|nr:hypothetical protein [Polyangiaceae bacterium]
MRAPLWIVGFLALTASRALAAEPAPPDDFAAALAAADQRFVAGDLAGALQILEPPCAAADRPECAFALGAIQHGLGHCEAALGHYRHYRELAPTGEHRAEVDAALQEVEAQCGSPPNPLPAPTPALPPQPPTPQPSAPLRAPQLPVVPPAALPNETGVPPLPAPDPLPRTLIVGSFALSGAAAVSSIAFAVLAAHSADRCRHHAVYDQKYIDECEQAGPSYQGLWQGFAIAAGAFAGIGATLWWFDANSSAAVELAGTGAPSLQYRRRF